MLYRLLLSAVPALTIIWGLHAAETWAVWEKAWDASWQTFVPLLGGAAGNGGQAASNQVVSAPFWPVLGFALWSGLGAAAGLLEGRFLPLFGLWITLLLAVIALFLPDWVGIPWPDIATLCAVVLGWGFALLTRFLPWKRGDKEMLTWWFGDRLSPLAMDSALIKAKTSRDYLLPEASCLELSGVVEVSLEWKPEAGDVSFVEKRKVWDELERRAREVWRDHPCWKANQGSMSVLLICGFPAVVPDPAMAARRLAGELEENLMPWVQSESPHFHLNLKHGLEALVSGPVDGEWKLIHREDAEEKKG